MGEQVGEKAQDPRVSDTKNQKSHTVTKLDCARSTRESYFTFIYLIDFLRQGFSVEPGTHYADQAGLEFRNTLPASVSLVL